MTVSAWPCPGLAAEAPGGYSFLAFVFAIWKARVWRGSLGRGAPRTHRLEAGGLFRLGVWRCSPAGG